jgi:hypothetical protein
VFEGGVGVTEGEVLDALRPFWERARCASPRMGDAEPFENGEGMDRVRRLTHGDLRLAQRLYDGMVGGGVLLEGWRSGLVHRLEEVERRVEGVGVTESEIAQLRLERDEWKSLALRCATRMLEWSGQQAMAADFVGEYAEQHGVPVWGSLSCGKCGGVEFEYTVEMEGRAGYSHCRGCGSRIGVRIQPEEAQE